MPRMSMDLPPLPPLDYADARPVASQLHCETAGDRLRVWRDPPPRGLLVKEFVTPLIALPLLGGWLIVVVVLIARTHAEGLPDLIRQRPGSTLTFLPLCGLFVYLLLDTWQNAGIVTRIEVADGWFTWTKQTLFGTKTYRWRADTITVVHVRSIGAENMLRVHRRGGFPLGAFSRCRREELLWIADALRAALGLTGS